MKVCLTGGAGFIGSNLAHKMSAFNYDYTVVDSLQFGFEKNLPVGCNFINKDIKDLDEEFLNQFDILIALHCSNIIYAIKNPIDTFINNVVSTISAFNKFKGKIIYCSTSSVYGVADQYPTKEDAKINLSNAYDSSKYAVELYLKERGNYTTLVFTNTYGERQLPENPYCGVLSRFVDRALADEALEIYGDGLQTRDMTYVGDVIEAILLAIISKPLNDRINIGTGIETTVEELCTKVWKAIDRPAQLIRLEPRKIDGITRRCLDNSKAKQLLGWTPLVTLDEGIKKTIEWLRTQ